MIGNVYETDGAYFLLMSGSSWRYVQRRGEHLKVNEVPFEDSADMEEHLRTDREFYRMAIPGGYLA